MQFQRLPGEITNHIYSFGTFKEKALCIGLLNKESNKMIDADMQYFDDWLFNLFVWNSRKLLITEWLRIPGTIPIEPLIRVIDDIVVCIHIESHVHIQTIRAAIEENKDRFLVIFASLNKKYNIEMWNAEEGKLHIPSWKHFMFQKEVVELCEELKLLEPTTTLPTGLLEFVEVIQTNGGYICSIVNFQKRELAFINFVSRSQAVRNKFKKVFPDAENHQLLAMEHALKLGMEKYNSQLLIL